MKPIWKGTIRLDSLQFPVKLYSATNPKPINLKKFHKTCLQRISHAKSCPIHGPVPEAAVLSAFPISENEFVPFDVADFKLIHLASQESLEVTEFIDLTEFDPLLIHKSYYVTPDGPIAKTKYFILKQALVQQQKLGLTKIVFSRKEYLAALWCRPPAIILSTLYYRNEITPAAEFEALKGRSRLARKQVEQVTNYIEQHSNKFRHTKYRDLFYKQFLAMIHETIQQSPAATFSTEKVAVATPPRKTMSKLDETEKFKSTGTD